MQYIYETHVHSSEVSRCGRVPARTVVENYLRAGYSGIVLTDHFNRDTFRHMPDAPWSALVDHFMTGYRAAVEAAAALDPAFTVLFGLELRLDTVENDDFLVFGADEDFLRRSEGLLEMTFSDMAQYVHENGLLLVQAHPFRRNMSIVDWNLLDGIEVYNGNPHHESNNPAADFWADRHRLLKTSGSDYHGEWGEHTGGIRTAEPICSNAQLLDILQSRNYTLYYQEEWST